MKETRALASAPYTHTHTFMYPKFIDNKHTLGSTPALPHILKRRRWDEGMEGKCMKGKDDRGIEGARTRER